MRNTTLVIAVTVFAALLSWTVSSPSTTLMSPAQAAAATGGDGLDEICNITGACKCVGLPTGTLPCEPCNATGVCRYCDGPGSLGSCITMMAATCVSGLRFCGDEVVNGTCSNDGKFCVANLVPILSGTSCGNHPKCS